MNVHKNARLNPRGREILISCMEQGDHLQDVVSAKGVSAGTVCKWRYRSEGFVELLGRSSKPKADRIKMREGSKPNGRDPA